MARDQGPFTPEEDVTSSGEFLRPEGGKRSRARLEPEDQGPIDVLDLEQDQQSPFLRAQKRVPVRRGPLPKKAEKRLLYVFIALLVICVLGAFAFVIYRYGIRSWRFQVESSDLIEVDGNRHVSRAQIMQVMGGEIGRNVFRVPLDERKRQLEEIPWIESASVMRFMPNRLRIQVRERTPVAFVQVNSQIQLIDAHGVIMDMPADGQTAYSFPVIVGFTDAEPLSTRAARMKIFMDLIHQLDSGGANNSANLSDIDLSDPDDVKVTIADPVGAVLVHLGNTRFLERYTIFVSQVQQWRQQYQRLDSVDLRYERQIILNPDPVRGEAQPAKDNTQAQPPAQTPKPEKKAARAAAQHRRAKKH